jgi:hypothetical protein
MTATNQEWFEAFIGAALIVGGLWFLMWVL